MNQVQEWFDKLFGITAGVSDRQRMADSLFRRPLFDAAAFQTPACWRRKSARTPPFGAVRSLTGESR